MVAKYIQTIYMSDLFSIGIEIAGTPKNNYFYYVSELIDLFISAISNNVPATVVCNKAQKLYLYIRTSTDRLGVSMSLSKLTRRILALQHYIYLYVCM